MSMNQHPNLPVDDDDDDVTIMPMMGTMTVKRQDLGIREINTGQYFLSQNFADTFKRIPAAVSEVSAVWQIELGLDGLGVPPLRYEVAGPIIIGRGQEANVSLAEYDALHYGISRKHAMLRPSRQALYFIELGSRNGSRINGIDVGPDKAHILALGDVIRLGTLTIVVRYLHHKG
jgi:hypothetical protein